MSNPGRLGRQNYGTCTYGMAPLVFRSEIACTEDINSRYYSMCPLGHDEPQDEHEHSSQAPRFRVLIQDLRQSCETGTRPA
jgi:hypothetical protein